MGKPAFLYDAIDDCQIWLQRKMICVPDGNRRARMSRRNRGLAIMAWVGTLALLPTSFAQTAYRPPNFFDDPDISFFRVAPGSLSDYLSALHSSPTGRYVFHLLPGRYTMPPNGALVNVSGAVLLQGAGVNTTYVDWQGSQRVLKLLPGASFEANNLTLTGMTATAMETYTAVVSVDLYPTIRVINAEMWLASDDLGVNSETLCPAASCPPTAAVTDGFCRLKYVPAIIAPEMAMGTTTVISRPSSDVLFTSDAVNFPGDPMNPFLLKYTDPLSSALSYRVFDGCWVRAAPQVPAMQILFSYLVALNPNAGRVDCFNSENGDNGFTYRGNESSTDKGQCLRWDDPRILDNVYFPNPQGFTSVQDNLCRNPRLSGYSLAGPWCFVATSTSTAPVATLCRVPACRITEPPSPPRGGGSSSLSGGAIAGIAIGCTVFVTLIVVAVAILCAWSWRRRRRRTTHESTLKAADPDMGGPRPWHVREFFEATEPLPPVRLLKSPNSAPSCDPASEPLATWRPDESKQLLEHIHTMLAPGIPIDSLAFKDLQYKYGDWWALNNLLDTNKFLGAGAISQVYAGTHFGQPAAYKVLNKMRPAEAMLRFIRKSVLPGVFFQRHPNFPLRHPHLLPLIDCVMFPQWYSLLELAKESDLHTKRDANVMLPVTVREHEDEGSEPSVTRPSGSRSEWSRGKRESGLATQSTTEHDDVLVDMPPALRNGVLPNKDANGEGDNESDSSVGRVFSYTSSLCRTSSMQSVDGLNPVSSGRLHPVLGAFPRRSPSPNPSRKSLSGAAARRGSAGVGTAKEDGVREVPALHFAAATVAVRRGLEKLDGGRPEASHARSLPHDLSNVPLRAQATRMRVAERLRLGSALPTVRSYSDNQLPFDPAAPSGLDADSDLTLLHLPPPAADDAAGDDSDVPEDDAASFPAAHAFIESPDDLPPYTHCATPTMATCRAAEGIRGGSPAGAVCEAAMRSVADAIHVASTTPSEGCVLSYASAMPDPVDAPRAWRPQRDLVCQIIMVSSLCELGTLNSFFQASKRFPVRILPPYLHDLMEREGKLGRDRGNPGESVQEHPDTVTFAALPSIWQAILKLQLCLQVISGVSALHATSLIHCDIKPDNIFLKQDPSFYPFGICAKIGDLDTCRSLLGNDRHTNTSSMPRSLGLHKGSAARSAAALLNEARRVETDFAAAAGATASAHTLYTSNMKGTPGYLSPEMISEGRVAPTTDVYSTAVTLSVVLSKSHRFLKYDDLHVKVIPEFMDILSSDVRQTLSDCVVADPSLRPSLRQLNAVLSAQFQRCLRMASVQDPRVMGAKSP